MVVNADLADSALGQYLRPRRPSQLQTPKAHLRHRSHKPLSRLCQRDGVRGRQSNTHRMRTRLMEIAVVASLRCGHLPNIITGNVRLLSQALCVAPDSKRAAATMTQKPLHHVIVMNRTESVQEPERYHITLESPGSLERRPSRPCILKKPPTNDPNCHCWLPLSTSHRGIVFGRRDSQCAVRSPHATVKCGKSGIERARRSIRKSGYGSRSLYIERISSCSHLAV